MKIRGTFSRKSTFHRLHCGSFMIRRQVRIPHGHGDVSVAHQFLHGANVHTRHDKPAGKGMAQNMGANWCDRTLTRAL